MSLAAWIVAFVATLIFGTGVGIKWEKGQEAIREVAAQEHAREVRAQRERGIDVAAEGHEKDKTQIQTEYVVITERIEDAKQTEFYAAGAPMCLDPDGVRIVNDAARSAAPASVNASAVRRPASAP